MREFNVLNWNINTNEVVAYDVLPYFRDCYDKIRKKSERPTTKEEWTDFVKKWGKYMYWSRCEYEIIVKPWPLQDKDVKIDVWKQIENNLDLVVELLMNEYGKET